MSGIWASVPAVLVTIPSWLQCCCHSSSHHIHIQGKNNWEGAGSAAHVCPFYWGIQEAASIFLLVSCWPELCWASSDSHKGDRKCVFNSHSIPDEEGRATGLGRSAGSASGDSSLVPLLVSSELGVLTRPCSPAPTVWDTGKHFPCHAPSPLLTLSTVQL